VKKSKLAKKAKHRKVVARKAAPRKVVRKVAKKRAVRKATPMSQVATTAETSVAPTDGAPPGSHLDAPAAGPHPGAGHQSVVRSEVKS
jgi:hypothetical protein